MNVRTLFQHLAGVPAPVAKLTQRDAAIRLLRARIDSGCAGLDPVDPSILIVNAATSERTWVACALERVGVVLTEVPRHGGGLRFRAVIEADVRAELGLDAAAATREPRIDVLHSVPAHEGGN